MPDTGTRERKRALEAMPPRLESASPGCVGAFVAYLALCLILYWATRSWWSLTLAAPALLVLASFVAHQALGLMLLSRSRRRLETRGVRCLVVYSESPNWEEYIRDKWLPRLGEHAVVLNWSQRSSWPSSLEVGLFRQFVGTERNFNPAVLVLRGLKQPHVFRFYYAFQQARHGRREYLEKLEAELFAELGV